MSEKSTNATLPQPNLPDKDIATLLKRVVDLKEQARRLMDRFIRRELSASEAQSEHERIESQLIRARRHVQQWQDNHPLGP